MKKKLPNGYGTTNEGLFAVCLNDHCFGSAFAISPRHIVTCTHVLNSVLGIDDDSHCLTEGQCIECDLFCGAELVVKGPLTVIASQPTAYTDLTVLLIPDGAQELIPMCLSQESVSAHDTLIAHGYPEGHWGEIPDSVIQLSFVANVNGGLRMHLNSPSESDGIRKGYSGGPLVNQDSQEVMGVIASYSDREKAVDDDMLRESFAIPIQLIKELHADLNKPLRKPYFQIEINKITSDVFKGANRPHTLSEYRCWLEHHYRALPELEDEFTPLKMHRVSNNKPENEENLNSLDEALLDKSKNTTLFLLKGLPGGGKTTLLQQLALQLLRKIDKIPVFVPMNAADKSSPEEVIQARLKTLTLGCTETIMASEVVWLLDGINELPAKNRQDRGAKYKQWMEWVQSLEAKHKVVISSRNEDSNFSFFEKTTDSIAVISVQPLNDAIIANYLNNKLGGTLGGKAKAYIDNNKLSGLYSTPLMLQLLIDMLKLNPDIDQFPQTRAGLFIKWFALLLERERDKEINACNATIHKLSSGVLNNLTSLANSSSRNFRPLLKEPLTKALVELAWNAQTANQKGREDAVQRITVSSWDVESTFQGYCGAESGFDDLARSLGILIQHDDMHTFRHQLFMEFFAAIAMASKLDVSPATAVESLSREALADIAAEQPNWGHLPGVETFWDQTTLMAFELCKPLGQNATVFLKKLSEVNLPLAGRCAALAETNQQYQTEEYTTLIDSLYQRMQDDAFDLRHRLAAGDALGALSEHGAMQKLGYTLFQRGDQKAWLPAMTTIEAGTYHYGSKDDPQAYDGEHSGQWQVKSSYQCALYPVTVAEFSCFINAGGYSDERYWQGDAARTARQGKLANQSDLITFEYWRNKRAGRDDRWLEEKLQIESGYTEKDIATIINNTPADNDKWQAVKERLENVSNPTTCAQPSLWGDQRFNAPTRPVIGVSVYEAMAYSCWLSELTGLDYSLPSELHWEVAIRSEGSVYPWGESSYPLEANQSEHLQANINDKVKTEGGGEYPIKPLHWVGHTSPVAMYGKSSESNVFDGLGSVWEWTCTPCDNLSDNYRDTELRSTIEDAKIRVVVRGGSWFINPRAARCAFRVHFTTDSRNYDQGFRVVCAPP